MLLEVAAEAVCPELALESVVAEAEGAEELVLLGVGSLVLGLEARVLLTLPWLLVLVAAVLASRPLPPKIGEEI